MSISHTSNLCPHCGNPYTPDAEYCGYCGNAVKSEDKKTILFQGDTSTLLRPSNQPFVSPSPSNQKPVRSTRQFWTRGKVIVLAAIILLLLSGGGLFSFAYQIGRNSVQTRPTVTAPLSLTPTNGGTLGIATPSPTMSSATPTVTRTIAPTRTAVPTKTVAICQSGAGNRWSNWNIGTPWTMLANGDLQNDPSVLISSLIIPSFCRPSTPNYAIEAIIRVVKPYDDFGIHLRYNPQIPNGTSNGYFGAIHTSNFYIKQGTVRIGVFDGGDIASGSTGIDFTQFHTYCFEAQGSTLTLFIDGSPVLGGTDPLYTQTDTGSVYAEHNTQIEISSFTVQTTPCGS